MYVSWLLVDFVASVGTLADVGGGRGEALASLACLPLLKAGFDLGDLGVYSLPTRTGNLWTGRLQD